MAGSSPKSIVKGENAERNGIAEEAEEQIERRQLSYLACVLKASSLHVMATISLPPLRASASV